ncbi:MAG: aminotransferase class III-fold pyridoxal phosphate-dependent enzyme [Proteobacteria bacterium]|nr:MAG: aminotransferase class III-fold pyridoxal phosphate-dependent enzyme [Pseudomonadota bacterium]
MAPRAAGAILAFELDSGGYFHNAAYQIPDLGRSHGLMLRTLGSTVYFVPSLMITSDELEQGLIALRQTIEDYRETNRSF